MTADELLDQVRLWAEEGARMPEERDLRRRLQRVAGEIRLWQSEQATDGILAVFEHAAPAVSGDACHN